MRVNSHFWDSFVTIVIKHITKYIFLCKVNWKMLGIAILFLTTMLFYSLRLSIAFLHFAVFNDNFTEMYCVNKDKPEMQCNGKCHLMQETKDTIPQQKGLILNESLHQQIILFFNSNDNLVTKKEIHSIFKKNNFKYQIHYHYQFLGNIFHPPNL